MNVPWLANNVEDARFDASSVQISYVDEVEAGALVGVESDRQPGRVASQAQSSSSPSAADLRLATY